jgi:phosphatidylglycerol lysyltransferase
LQLILVGIDVAGAALALFVLLPPIHTGFIGFLGVYTIALSLGVIGHTPGGLGVFETAMVFALGGTVSPEAAVAALLAYRAIYFILPLLLSGALLAAFEVRAIAIRLAPRGFVVPSPRVAQLVPMFLGVISFAIGVMLLVSGATPALATDWRSWRRPCRCGWWRARISSAACWASCCCS